MDRPRSTADAGGKSKLLTSGDVSVEAKDSPYDSPTHIHHNITLANEVTVFDIRMKRPFTYPLQRKQATDWSSRLMARFFFARRAKGIRSKTTQSRLIK